MASAEKYARWIVANEDKRGTPEFDTVAKAYRLARQEESAELEGPSSGEMLAQLKPDYTFGEAISKGFTRGKKQLSSALGDVLPAMAARGLGFDEYAQEQMEEAAQTQQEIAREYAPQVQSYKDVAGPRDALMYAAETISEQVPNILTSLVPGVGTGALMARTAASAATKAAAQNAAVFLGSYAQSAPEVFQNIYQETGEMAPGASLLFGAAAGALDSVLPAKLAKALTGPVKAGVVEKLLEGSGMERGLLRSVTANTLESMGVEGVTEGAQEAISIAAERFINDNPEVFGNKEWDRIFESAIRGAIAGGPFGAIEGAVDTSRESAQRRQAEEAQRVQEEERAQVQAQQAADAEIGQTLDEFRARNTEPQLLLPGIEPEPYISTLVPTEIDSRTKEQKKAAAVAEKAISKEDAKQADKQTELFAPRASWEAEAKLTPFAQKMAERNAKRVEFLAKEEAKQVKLAEQAKTKQEREAAKQKAIELKAERVRLSKQIKEQPELPFGEPAPLPSEVPPTEQGDTFDLFAARPTPAATTEAIPEPTVRKKPEKFTTIDALPSVLPEDPKLISTAFGLTAKAPILKQLVGKDLTNPEVVADLADIVVPQFIEAQRKKAPNAPSIGRFESFLERLKPAQPAAPVATETQPEAARTSDEVPVPAAEPTVQGTPATGGERLAGPSVPAPVPPAGEGGVGAALETAPAPAAEVQPPVKGKIKKAAKPKAASVPPAPVVETQAATPKAAPTDEERRAGLEARRSELMKKASAANLREKSPISDDAYEAIKNNLKRYNFERAEKLLKGATPIRDEGTFRGPKYKGASFDDDTRRLVEQGNVKEAVGRIAQRSSPAVRNVLRKVQSLNLRPKVEIRKADMPGSGAYDPRTNTIVLDPDSGLNDHIFVHELIHSALVNVLGNPELKITKDFTKFFTQIKNQMGDAYGGQDLQEFASELVGNPEFQALLKTIKAPRSESFFKKIMRAIADFFGFPPNAYDAGLKFVSDALDISEGVEVLPWDKMFYGPGNFEAVAEIGRSMPKATKNAIEEAKNVYSNLTDGGGFKETAFGLLRLDNMNDMFRTELPGIQKLLNAIERRTGDEARRINDVNAKAKKMRKTLNRYPNEVARMDQMAIDARLAQVDILDPKFTPTPKNRAEYDRLKQVFNALPSDVQDVYRVARKDFDAQLTEYRQILMRAAEDASPSLAKRLQTQFAVDGMLVGYVPFARYGDFWVEYTDPATKERAAAAFESFREREQFINRELAPKKIDFRKYEQLENALFDPSNVLPTSTIGQIMSNLQKQGAEKGLPPDAIRAQMDSVYQIYLSMFPGQSIMKQFIKAKNTPGMSKDLIRGYSDLMVRWAQKMPNAIYLPQINEALNEIKAQKEGQNETVKAAARNILNQSAFMRDPTFNNLVNAATSFSYFEYIAGNISSAIVNLTSLPLLVWPILSRFGFGKASDAMLSAGRVAMNDWSKGKYAALYKTLMDHGQLEHTMAREILNSRRKKSSDYTSVWARVMDGLSVPFAATEKYNRSVTAIAAYELARGKNMSEQEAIDFALKTTKDAHTSGIAATGPRWMQNAVGRIFFTFKSFVWNSAYVAARAFHQWAKGQTPEVRAAARRQVLGMFGMASVLTGVKGMPFYGAFSVLGTMMQAMLGDDDEPFDFHEEARNFFGELGYKGGLNYLLNLEISNRAGIATDLVFRDDPRGVEQNGYVLSAMKNAFGPAGSYLVGAERGIRQMAEGNVWRGVESLLPSWTRNGLKGARYMQEGALTLKGDPVDEDISAWNSLNQIIGFSPADLSSRYEKISAAKAYEKKINDRRQRLIDLYDMARTSGDTELLAEAKARINEYRLARIGKPITQDTLERSFRARKAAEKEMLYGVRFDKNLRSQIEEKFFSEEDEE
jgi:hypothetical protein